MALLFADAYIFLAMKFFSSCSSNIVMLPAAYLFVQQYVFVNVFVLCVLFLILFLQYVNLPWYVLFGK